MSRAAVETLFTLAYGGRPAVVTSAPGRVNLIGEHLDYSGGAVLPIAIAQRTWVAIGRGRTDESRAVSREFGTIGTWPRSVRRPSGEWWDYVAGALDAAEPLGASAGARDVAVVSDVPVGAGLSSSAALEVATVLAALALDGVPVAEADVAHRAASGGGVPASRRAVADAAHRAETEYVGVACGVMDQYASAMCRAGHALHLQCDTGETRSVAFTRAVLIVDTATPRELRNSAYNTRRAECEAALAVLRERAPGLRTLAQATPELLEAAALPAPLDRRARHVVTETRRVAEFVALCAGIADPRRMGALLNASHRSLRDDYECSTPQLDWVVERSVARTGIDGARLTGAGWGGCAIVIGDRGTLTAFASELASSFEVAWERAPRTWITGAHQGARVES